MEDTHQDNPMNNDTPTDSGGDDNRNPMRAPQEHESSVGPMVGIIIILIVIVLGGYFFLTSKTNLIEDQSDEVSVIESDLEAESEALKNLDEELDELDAELEALDQELEE